jgi:hypothetical protein
VAVALKTAGFPASGGTVSKSAHVGNAVATAGTKAKVPAMAAAKYNLRCFLILISSSLSVARCAPR